MALDNCIKRLCPPPPQREIQVNEPVAPELHLHRIQTRKGVLVVVSSQRILDQKRIDEDPYLQAVLAQIAAAEAANDQKERLFATKKYYPLDGSQPLSLPNLIMSFNMGPQELMERVGIEHFKICKRPAKDHQLEFIRSALFALKYYGITEEIFCKIGKDKIADIKRRVAEYEQSKGGPSWETL